MFVLSFSLFYRKSFNPDFFRTPAWTHNCGTWCFESIPNLNVFDPDFCCTMWSIVAPSKFCIIFNMPRITKLDLKFKCSKINASFMKCLLYLKIFAKTQFGSIFQHQKSNYPSNYKFEATDKYTIAIHIVIKSNTSNSNNNKY